MYLRQLERELLELQGDCTKDKLQKKAPEGQDEILLTLCKVACTALFNMQALLTGAEEPQPLPPSVIPPSPRNLNDIAPGVYPQAKWDAHTPEQKATILKVMKAMGKA